MATLQELKDRTRLELSDLKVPFYERFTGSGTGTRFDLKGIRNVDQVVLYELENPSNPLTEGTDYTLHPRDGMIVFPAPPDAGKHFVAEGEYSTFFSDEEIDLFVRSAFGMHTRGRGINYSALPGHEVILVAILAKIEALWVLKTSSAYDINVHAPEGMFIPRGQRFEQLNLLLQEMETRYRELSGALGVGLYAVEMFNLRRVSRTTGRYVPIYLDREFDDTRPPQRVYPDISPMGDDVAVDEVLVHDLHVRQGEAFEESFWLEDDDGEIRILTGDEEFTSRLMKGKHTAAIYPVTLLPEFTISVDTSEDTVSLTLSEEETSKLETTGDYFYHLKGPNSEGDTITLVQGRVRVTSDLPEKSTNIQV